jgi:phospholipid transport system transporter-binding protein
MIESYSLTFDEKEGVLHLGGELTFLTAKDIVSQAKMMVEAMTVLNLDFSEVTRSDSAALAILVDWMRIAKKESKAIIFHNVPQQILAIANASGLDEFLPLNDLD